MKLLVTGSRGFVGGSVGRFAAAAGHDVLGVGRSSQPEPDWPGTEVVLIGRGGESPFAPLIDRFSSVQYLGVLPHEEIKLHLADAQIMLITSEWESFHIAAHEALCLGCSLVGPRVIPITDVCHDGNFGTAANSRTPHSLAQALSMEIGLWDQGQRSSAEIACFWRQFLSGVNVMNHLIHLYRTEKMLPSAKRLSRHSLAQFLGGSL